MTSSLQKPGLEKIPNLGELIIDPLVYKYLGVEKLNECLQKHKLGIVSSDTEAFPSAYGTKCDFDILGVKIGIGITTQADCEYTTVQLFFR